MWVPPASVGSECECERRAAGGGRVLRTLALVVDDGVLGFLEFVQHFRKRGHESSHCLIVALLCSKFEVTVRKVTLRAGLS